VVRARPPNTSAPSSRMTPRGVGRASPSYQQTLGDGENICSVTSQGSVQAWFERACDRGQVLRAEMAVREMPHVHSGMRRRWSWCTRGRAARNSSRRRRGGLRAYCARGARRETCGPSARGGSARVAPRAPNGRRAGLVTSGLSVLGEKYSAQKSLPPARLRRMRHDDDPTAVWSGRQHVRMAAL
jgi:hypothetical protein